MVFLRRGRRFEPGTHANEFDPEFGGQAERSVLRGVPTFLFFDPTGAKFGVTTSSPRRTPTRTHTPSHASIDEPSARDVVALRDAF
jgi:hypothetical protein